jgi:8-oxo-dGTP diphosphatase
VLEHWPQVGVGAFVVKEDSILLVQRGREPGKGEWAIPGGKVQPGEALRTAAEREILEETGVTIEAHGFAWQFELIQRDAVGKLQYHYVVLDFFARYLSGEPRPADDAVAARWVRFDELDALNLSKLTRQALDELFAERMIPQ